MQVEDRIAALEERTRALEAFVGFRPSRTERAAAGRETVPARETISPPPAPRVSAPAPPPRVSAPTPTPAPAPRPAVSRSRSA